MVAGKRVSEVMQELACVLELSVVGLDGITIAYDYDAALAELSRGFNTSG